MSFARLRLVVAAAAFLGWLGWLGHAVLNKGTVQIVSRAQLTAATYLVVADVTTANNLPAPAVTVKQVLRSPAGEAVPATLTVRNLPKAATPLPAAGESRTPPAGEYLLPLVRDADGFAVAGLPRSPGYDGAPDPERPIVYPWAADVQAQLRKLGLLP